MNDLEFAKITKLLCMLNRTAREQMTDYSRSKQIVFDIMPKIYLDGLIPKFKWICVMKGVDLLYKKVKYQVELEDMLPDDWSLKMCHMVRKVVEYADARGKRYPFKWKPLPLVGCSIGYMDWMEVFHVKRIEPFDVQVFQNKLLCLCHTFFELYYTRRMSNIRDLKLSWELKDANEVNGTYLDNEEYELLTITISNNNNGKTLFSKNYFVSKRMLDRIREVGEIIENNKYRLSRQENAQGKPYYSVYRKRKKA